MDELKRQTRKLDDDVVQLTEEVHRLNARQDRTDKVWRWLVLGLALLLGLVGLVGFVAFRSENTASKVEAQRSELWCPVFARAVGNYNPPPEPGVKRDEYEQNYALIKRGFYEVLRCSNPPIHPQPPR